jgi:hypothetical protein
MLHNLRGCRGLWNDARMEYFVIDNTVTVHSTWYSVTDKHVFQI